MRTAIVWVTLLGLAGCSRLDFDSLGAEHRSSWSDGRRRVDVAVTGEVEFADDDRDVAALSDGGFLVVQESRWMRKRRVEFSPGPAGAMKREYWVNGQRREYDEGARQWVAEILPEVMRHTTIGARSRAQRVLRRRGPEGVLEEFPRLRGDGVKRVFLEEFYQAARLEAEDLRRAARLVGQEIHSDGERARVLMEAADLYLAEEQAQGAFFEAIGKIGSDGDRRRVLVSLAEKERQRWDAALPAFLEVTRRMGSSGDQRQVLLTLLERVVLNQEQVERVVKTAERIDSEGDRRQVLQAVLSKRRLSQEALTRMVQATEGMGSDGEKKQLLLGAIESATADGPLAEAVVKAAQTLGSEGDRAQVLGAALRKDGWGKETAVRVVKAAAEIHSEEAKERVLREMPESYLRDKAVAAAYVDATHTIRSGDRYRRVMSALYEKRGER
jgi:hypothetical protein